MDPNFDFDRLWKQIIDETLENNTEEIIRYLRKVQQKANNNSQTRQTRCHINHDREGGHSRLLNDNFSENYVYTKTVSTKVPNTKAVVP